jgi:ribosome-binding protein aMBF1 (putative translation factor)
MMNSAREAKARMKKNRYSAFKEHALTRPKVREAFEEGLDVVRLAVSVAELREKRGLTQTQLAAQLHTSPAVISRIENGVNVELKILHKLARALHAQLRIELVAA